MSKEGCGGCSEISVLQWTSDHNTWKEIPACLEDFRVDELSEEHRESTPAVPQTYIILASANKIGSCQLHRESFVDIFCMPKVWWSHHCKNSNGFFGYETTGGTDTDAGFNTWAYFEVKQLDIDKSMRYQWYRMNIFTRWIPSTRQTLILIFDAPPSILNIQRIAAGDFLRDPDPAGAGNDPFWVYAGLAAEIARLQDSAVWTVRNHVREIETTRQPVKPRPDYGLLHDIARHAIHVTETLDVATQTMRSIMLGHEDFVANESAFAEKDAGASRNIQRRLVFFGNMLENLRHRSASNEKRLLNEIQLAFNIVAQYDAGISVEIGHAARLDNAAMKTISFVSLAFLPPTFICTIFSMSFFDYSVDSGWTVSHEFWVYWAFAIPITIVSFLVWKYWHKVFPLGKDELPQPAIESQDELMDISKVIGTRYR